MRITEVADVQDPNKLLGLVQFLKGRSEDTGAKQQINAQTFATLAQQLGVNVTTANLDKIINRPPLDAILEPYDPTTGIITFKGLASQNVDMPVDKAQDIVAKAAKSALRRASQKS
jgi:hypothetical protein